MNETVSYHNVVCLSKKGEKGVFCGGGVEVDP